VCATLAACARRDDAPKPDEPTPEHAIALRWEALEREMGKLRAFIESRLEFEQRRRDSLTPEQRTKVDAAKSSFGEMEQEWSLGQSAFLSGDVAAAVKHGEAARLEARETLRLLGIDPG
jgi:hypothetical protein